jgi:hypothetical protein
MLLYFGLFAGICAVLIGATIVRPRLIYEYPYFMAATFAVFILPQAYAIYRNEWGGIYGETTLLMCFLCLGCCWLGYQRRPHAALLAKVNFSVDPARFLIGGIVLVIVGSYFMYQFATLPEEELSSGEQSSLLTGIGTVYLFFGGLVYPGFAICLYCALRRGWLLAWLAATAAAIIPVQSALFYGRREPTVLFLMSIGVSIFFIKGKQAPRLAIIAAVIGAMLIIPATSEYRTLAREDPLEAFKQIDFGEEFRESLAPEAISELKNAVALIAATQAMGGYEYGAGYWNRIVFRFVPAQFVGKDVKTSLMIGGEQRNYKDFVEDVLGFRLPVGLTVTGVGDSFNQFGYFGCLFFAAVAYLFKTLWAAANRPNGTVAQILYIQVTTSAMRAATHQTVDFLPGFVYGAIFIGAIAFFARERTASASPVSPVHAPAQLLSK